VPTALAPQRGVLRAVRGSVLAVTSALLAGTAHVAAGAPAPGGTLTVLLTVGVAAAGTALADRRRGPVALLAAVGTTQVLMHLLLHGNHSHAAPVPPATMVTAHAVAVVVTALLLARAEAAVFAVAAAWRRIVAAVPLRLPLPPRRRAGQPVVPAEVPTPLRLLLATLLRRRGPPVRS